MIQVAQWQRKKGPDRKYKTTNLCALFDQHWSFTISNFGHSTDLTESGSWVLSILGGVYPLSWWSGDSLFPSSDNTRSWGPRTDRAGVFARGKDSARGDTLSARGVVTVGTLPRIDDTLCRINCLASSGLRGPSSIGSIRISEPNWRL